MVSYWQDISGLMIVTHHGYITITACCAVQAPSSRQVVGESGLSTKRRGWV